MESIGWQYPNINPILLELPGPFAIRWYGMMYLVGFAIGFLILRRLAKTGRLPVNVDQVGELLGLLALGVIVGGRLGYVLFYSPSIIFNNPLEIFVLWEGGLSFHGGLIGVALAFWWFTRRAGVPFLTVADGIVLAAPPGIAAVRLANFINGELFGRVAPESVPWAMRFPTDPAALRLMGTSASRPEEIYRAVKLARADGSWQQIESQIPLRHPSQLYEAALEGVFVFSALWALVFLARRFGWRVRKGVIGALFLIGYAGCRIFVENFRQPDRQFTGPGDSLGTVLGPLTMGQVLSIGMLLAGVVILILVMRGKGPEGISCPIDAGEISA
ncbi:prolipoprotein diacylglyceryl transferase [Candidatus Zixiibacteriota bacterium]